MYCLVRRTSCWPIRLPQEVVELRSPSKVTFIRLRKQGRSKHILGGLKVAWRLIFQHLRTGGPAVLSREALYKILFLNRKCSMNDEVYKGCDRDRWKQWNYHRSILWHNMHNNAFFFLAGCGRSLGYRQSKVKRHLTKSRTSDISR